MMNMYLWINETALLLSVFVYSFTQERKEKFKKRFVICAISYFVFAFYLNQLIVNEIIDASIFIRLFWYFLIILILKVCWETKWSYAVYYAMWSFITWQLLYELWYMITAFKNINTSDFSSITILSNVFVFVVGYSIAAATFARWMTEGCISIGPRQLSSGLLIFWIFEIIGMAQRRVDISVADSRWELLYLTQILIAVVLYLQNELFKKSALRQELALMNLLNKKEHEQYQLAKENIELINQKCHDLKHQIRAIRNMDKEDIDEYLEDVEKSVHIYEAIAQTGNEVLDTILTEKSLYCASQDITISCVADGSQLGFINTIDLYTLLGNALDNAIEAVEQFEEKEKRQIDVVIYKQQQFLVINILNPAPQKLTFEEELPVTTKGDKDYHGYGIKSMKYVVKKYDGFMNIKTENECFMLEILFPIPKTT